MGVETWKGKKLKKNERGGTGRVYKFNYQVSFPCLMFEVLLESRLNWWHFKK